MRVHGPGWLQIEPQENLHLPTGPKTIRNFRMCYRSGMKLRSGGKSCNVRLAAHKSNHNENGSINNDRIRF